MHGAPTIFLARHRRPRWTLFNELTHCAHGRIAADHAPQFAVSWVRLVGECWDPVVASRLATFVERVVERTPCSACGAPAAAPDQTATDEPHDPSVEEDRIAMRRRTRASVERIGRVTAAVRRRGGQLIASSPAAG